MIDKVFSKLNNNLGNLKQVLKEIPANGTITITHTTAGFAYLVNVQGSLSNAWACYVLQGYGAGTSVRNRIMTIGAGEGITIELVDNKFIISNTTTNTPTLSITVLLGELPFVM